MDEESRYYEKHYDGSRSAKQAIVSGSNDLAPPMAAIEALEKRRIPDVVEHHPGGGDEAYAVEADDPPGWLFPIDRVRCHQSDEMPLFWRSGRSEIGKKVT